MSKIYEQKNAFTNSHLQEHEIEKSEIERIVAHDSLS